MDIAEIYYFCFLLVRSLSMSSNSSTSTRSSMTKSSSSSTNVTQQSTISSQRISKRSLSPPIAISLERPSQKRRRAREQSKKKTSSASATIIKIDDDENDIEQENDDDDDDDDNDDTDLVPIKVEKSKQRRQSKQRQASSGSIEYVQILDNEQQLTSSLNNIENIKSKSKINDEEIIICRSPPSVKKVIPSPNKNHSKASVNGTSSRKSNIQQVITIPLDRLSNSFSIHWYRTSRFRVGEGEGRCA
jgi:hypothetical protein